jgi:hypothetical protein
MRTIINPKTGRKIFVGGPTYMKLKNKSTTKKRKVTRKGTRKVTRKGTRNAPKVSKKLLMRMKRKSRYTPKDGPFCGPSGGAPPMSYPIGTKKRMNNALSRSVNAPNPEGVRKCATNYGVKKGWITKEHQRELLNT